MQVGIPVNSTITQFSRFCAKTVFKILHFNILNINRILQKFGTPRNNCPMNVCVYTRWDFFEGPVGGAALCADELSVDTAVGLCVRRFHF
jgi:hypothetical protein